MAAHPEPIPEMLSSVDVDDGDPTIEESSGNSLELKRYVGNTEGIQARICSGYTEDSILSKVITHLKQHLLFQVTEGFVYVKGHHDSTLLCIPCILHDRQSLTGVIIEQAHNILDHFRSQRTADYIHRWYWWPQLGKEVEKFC
ncbi:hypothetical protein PAXINDRAFT_17435 [Paxillus involutus ATCC 200175]|uniref:Integrase zinc-binding domain-containing protein n=1 Tax=Paxillus involutus ATCC 200175 TaxID=664439 RepID=A0A0C9TET9_PAXIN|nr:hypothetical protein PAXINDRAFT_17435 [Paxillus involutus ATCC 200175]